MEYQALYRAFRPQTFEDVVGQKHVTKTLRNAIIRNKESHAYLFSGPRGTGKTSIAKIFAKALNCRFGSEGEPCNECDICMSITEGSANDVIEIDAASNNGVDEIRNIREKVKYAPSEAMYKVYIIDEVHMLTTGAFNALLKTLEEPPGHAIFILATTEPHKIPATIISRCQRFDFKAIELNEIVERLEYVAQSESLEYESDAIEYIARTSEGGMRDALSIMDQVIAYSNDVITLDDAIMITGGIKSEELNDWLKLIDHRDSREAFIKYHQFIEEGKDPTRLIHELVYYIRDIILMKHDGEINEDVAFAHTEDKVLYEMIDVLNDAMVMMRFSVNTSVHLEVVIVKLIQVLNRNDQSVEPQAVDLSHIEQKLAELDKKLSNYSQAPNSQAQEPQKREETQSRSSKGFSLRQIEKVLDNANKEDLVKLKDDWPKVYQHVEEKGYHALRSLIKDSEPVAASDTHVLLKFKSDLHSDLINKDEKKRQELEAVIPSIIGKDVKVVGVPDSSWLQVRHDYIQEKKANKEKKSDEDGKKPSDVAKEIFGSDVVETRS
ncbi:DNA polymerase III subunit gamma/tau [Salinicoccus roseus]|jgi:DNA polymerase-3 subunit gamma/tau|uniref:DNA-directed DNA polymerase n=1 Tax=Salinicoccus roseus TaxID=45670 RepID=A0A265E3Z1_9STAP|nr:DNA polymerase III subunit gamma/tau [Salinicoccus roseus]MBY8910307.1 DNA polymerase III subunit gamma/tau [Salinicoccus roseus]OZT76297.1 DNA polymerase III subunit gamma/tau [Salinicoccus roseus]RPE51193.1 DNA polymerase III tau subunit [Salinicoccus roseus]GGA77250.1 DNA polymerase III subunit gamma/tau [Salinicoccus roseus]